MGRNVAEVEPVSVEDAASTRRTPIVGKGHGVPVTSTPERGVGDGQTERGGPEENRRHLLSLHTSRHEERDRETVTRHRRDPRPEVAVPDLSVRRVVHERGTEDLSRGTYLVTSL